MPKHPKLKKIIIVLIIIILLGLIGSYLQNLVESPQEAAQKIKEMGIIGPIIIISLIILEVIIAPLPGWFFSITSGFAFGIVWGSFYSYIGNLIGTSIAFLIARRFGRPLIKKIIKKQKFEKYDQLFHEKGKRFLWLVYFFPLLPIDLISYAIGLSKMKFKEFFLIVSIALISYNIILGYLGSAIFDFSMKPFFHLPLILVLALMAVFIIHYFIKAKTRK